MATTAIPNVSTAADEPPVAETLAPIVRALLGDPPPVRMEFWDGSALGQSRRASARCSCDHRTPSGDCCGAPTSSAWPGPTSPASSTPMATSSSSSAALRAALPEDLRSAIGQVPAAIKAARRLGVLGRPLPPPPLEAKLHGGRHSARRDAAAIHHHYDVGNDFYRLVLGPAMTYSCARFVDDTHRPDDGAGVQARPHLPQARARHDGGRAPPRRRVRLGLDGHPRRQPLRRRRVVGITISEAQAALARERVAEAGVADRVEIRLQDYRDIGGQEYDAISSIGMSEHVGHQQPRPLLRAAARRPAAGRSAAQPRHQQGRRVEARASRRSSAATCSPTAS